LGSARSLRRQGRRVRRALVRPRVQEVGRPRAQGRAALDGRARAGARRQLFGQARHGDRGDQALDAGSPAALRPDQPAARSERALRLLRQGNARAGRWRRRSTRSTRR
jgi:hypothetical protein